MARHMEASCFLAVPPTGFSLLWLFGFSVAFDTTAATHAIGCDELPQYVGPAGVMLQRIIKLWTHGFHLPMATQQQC